MHFSHLTQPPWLDSQAAAVAAEEAGGLDHMVDDDPVHDDDDDDDIIPFDGIFTQVSTPPVSFPVYLVLPGPVVPIPTCIRPAQSM